MNRDLTIRQWKLHQHGSAQFTKPTPRTAREAFGCEFECERKEDAWVFIVVMVALVVGLGVVSWL